MSDRRVEFIESRVASCFKNVPSAKFSKLFDTEDNQNKFVDFFHKDEHVCLFFPNDGLQCALEMPTKLGKAKSLVIVKLHPGNTLTDKIMNEVVCIELTPDPVQHLELLAQEIYLPILSNPQNQDGWGEVAAKEIMDKFHSFLSSISITVGQTLGKTCLPLPPIDLTVAASNKNRISMLEGAIITWTKQIKNVLKQDPEGLLKQGLHPTPDVEIEFWKNKAANLNSIFEQLQSERIRRVLRALDHSKSTYCTTFARLCKEVFTARIEANDNMKYLRTLEDWFARLNSEDDFPKLMELFKPMLHIILLIWKNSKHYNTPARLVVLMREICNALINQACVYVSGEQIFELIGQEEAGKAVEQLKTTLKVCGTFKATYFDYKATANAECPGNPWRIQNNALFMRLDSFLERCHDILDLTQTIVQFSKLAKIEVGGTKGKTLTASVQQIHTDFQTAVSAFQNVPYDIMDVSAKQFDDDFYEFRCRIKELERRLGSVLTQGFDDCATIYGRFKLLDSFEGLLDRPIIQDELEKKHIALVQAYGADLKTVQELFLQNRDMPPISWNLPPIAGSLTWCRGLVERIREPMEKLSQMNKTIMDREEAKEVVKVYATIIASLQEYENQKIEEWGRDVESSSQAKLKLPLLQRHASTRLLHVNFDPALVRLLREVKYFLLLGLQVPDSALQIYKKAEVFRRETGNLDLIVNMYNNMMTSLLPVEGPLVRSHLDKIDRAVSRGIDVMNWKSRGIDTFITESMDAVKAANTILSTLKQNLSHVEDILSGWDKALLERKPKPVAPAEFEKAHKSVISARYSAIKEGGHEIHRLLKESNKVLKVSNGLPDWKAYVDFVNNIVVDGLAKVVVASLTHLAEQLGPDSNTGGKGGPDRMPLLEIELTLFGKDVMFTPEIGSTAAGNGVRDIVNNWIGSFFHVATIFKRLDNEGTYMKELHEDVNVCMLLAVINENLSAHEQRCHEFRAQYQDHSYLWTSDLPALFGDFCADATISSEQGQELLDLVKFDDAISKYTGVQQSVSELKTPVDVGWLRINSQPIKQAMNTWVSKWVTQYTSHLYSEVLDKLNNLREFMERVTAGLDVEVGEKDKNSLMDVMGDIRDVRKRMDTTVELFGPLRETVLLLKSHGVNMEDSQIGEVDVQDYLEGAPLQWEALVNKTFKKKEEILPLQTAEVESIKEGLEKFFLSMRAFRNDFRAEAPFAFDGSPDEAYSQMDNHALQLEEKVAQAAKFNELEELFELQVSKYQETADTRAELRLLKGLWDFMAMTTLTFDRWKTNLWSEINTERLDEDNKSILKQIRKMGNENPVVKGWQVYRDIENMVKNMSVVLPLVNDLHSPSMRDRHWKQLSSVCRTKPIDPKDPKFTFEDMLGLKLHEHVDDVSEIVETANKELKIEKKLSLIETTWAGLNLDFVQHKESEISIIKPAEEVVEALDGNQLELQTMIGMGKFVDYFRDRVMHWQRTLGNVESVLKEWVSVSKQWASLESIFLASADIRSQLPEDTKRFEGIDSEFKDLMKEAINVPNVVDACTADDREELLKGMTRRLELCQKSLNEYLDMKKKIFPRFYFVSNVALLEILSNGNNPPKIMPFLGDCYDSLSNLKFCEGSMDTASTMMAKDGEKVELDAPFTMKGAVESWLNGLTRAMQNCLRFYMDNAIETAVNWEVEKPRHLWLFDYPAQMVLTATQIYWTEEAEQSLEEYENGQEDSVKRYLAVCNTRLDQLILLVLGKLAPADRVKIISLITLDVHARDVVQKLIDDKTPGPLAFLWQQQLRFFWQQDTRDVNIRITDYRCKYSYEWIGNTGRLVITPLTDRCYITLTMAMRLFLGGAPAGPAGTGKTETTKDLARALALPCYVFNCSDQMNYQTMADIFRGLSQTGSWGCFDEFNRIPIEVLSVVATQVKTVQDAVVLYSVAANREEQYQSLPSGTPPVVVGTFDFMGDTISLIPTCGFFITMNPGYAGRTELPENLKVLFRSCAMIRPDLKPICENMLMSEGFQTARVLSIKFVTLYQLSSELLSPQPHYDWGLRAVKSVLRVAGNLKRMEPDLEEAMILMRALRDFNTPKIPQHDAPIFLRLISDLFIGLDVPVKVDRDLWKRTVQVCKNMGLQYDEGFVMKVVQYQELLDVRHSVMLIGSAGCGKTTIWQALAATHNLDKPKKTCVFETVNPKSVTSDELYGYMTLSKDWKDGVLSIIMRGMSKNYSEQGFHEFQTNKWVVLDGDIDAVWIESMNTVMDDNKVLTLVSNERIPLSGAMRMVFEINSLKNATPATVSRAGILFINEMDIGWRPFMESWVAKREDETERTYLPPLFDRYIEGVVEMTRKGYKTAVPLRLINMVSTLCYLLEGLLPTMMGDSKTSENIEAYFVYACTWAFAGPMIIDKSGDYRKTFHEMWIGSFSTVKYPKEGLMFDYYYDHEAGDFALWADKVPHYDAVPIGVNPGETPFTALNVSTMDTIRLTYLMDTLVRRGRPVMMVGGAGTGKTTLIQQYLKNVDENFLSCNINMNFYTDSKTLQTQIEGAIDKRSGRIFGPPATKTMIYFVDDLNLPYIEEYGTQNSLALLRQHMDYRTFFDRADLGFRKEVVDVQYLSAMNPTAGSFTINERLQRHYATFACMMPGQEDLRTIYREILSGHLSTFSSPIQALAEPLTNASINLHETVAQKFLPSATKFVYNWNMRELTNIFQGLCLAKGDLFTKPVLFARLWVHECNRVFADRLINEAENTRFHDILVEVSKKFLEVDMEELHAEPIIFTSFASATTGEPTYLPVPDMVALKKVLDERLQEYNESNAMMDLVLFDQAMEHVTRIARIIWNPAGNAMLIGVGGSGKQSLSRLAAFICGYETSQLSVTSSFKVDDLKESLREMFRSAGVKGNPIMFLMTDTQVVNDRFLIYINDLLSSGWIPDLFARDEMDGLFGGLRNEAKAAGIPDTPDTMLEFLISRIRLNLHVVLCFSPVGDVFRVRARRFPGLVNCTAIDWFHPWPRDALVSVAQRFLDELDLGTPETKENVSHHMAEIHLSVTLASRRFLSSRRRYNYVTPKSFLELISFYKFLLNQKRLEVQRLIDRLDVGLSTLRKTTADVAELQVDLKHTMEKVEEKRQSTDVLLQEMGVQRAEAEVQRQQAEEEGRKAGEAAQKAAEIEEQASGELAAAKPAMDAAAKAVDVLSKAMLTELKSLAKPPTGVDKVTTCCLIMVEHEYKNHSWDRAKKMMSKVDAFKEKLQLFRGEDIPEEVVAKLEPIMSSDGFSMEEMLSKSAAAANLCTWVVNIYTYNRIYVRVKPLMDSLEVARTTKAAAEQQLARVMANLGEVEKQLQNLEDTFMEATEEKAAVEKEAEACLERLGLAERLVGGLSSENERWGMEIEKLKENAVTLVGDVLLAAAFVSYIGAFDTQFRQELWSNTWIPDLVAREIPLTVGVDPLSMLTNDGNNARMMSEGLPADRISIENGSIIINAKRWPLIIDPQLQGIKWLRQKEAERSLVVTQMTAKQWLRNVENAITNGTSVILENLGEEIEATLDPVLARAVYRKGRTLYLRLGGEEVEYDPNFRLFLQTKLSNPHYKPEIAAQCTLVNFIATESGLEDQLLAKVVNVEQPELEQEKQDLVKAFQQYKIQLVDLEDQLLERLANAPDDILSDIPLIEGLEATKAAAVEINAAVKKGKETEIAINVAREQYRKAAAEGAMLYFQLTNLCSIDHMYQYSLDSFTTFFFKAIERAPPAEKQEQRVLNLRESMRFTIFTWVSRGLFESHKLIFLSTLCFELMKRGVLGEDNKMNEDYFQFLLRGPKKLGEENPLDWLPTSAWTAVQSLADLEDFNKFSSDLVEAAPRFREWYNHVTPEMEKLPLDWASLDRTPFLKMLVVRCLRPDRMTVAVANFVRGMLPNGNAYADCDSSLNSGQIMDQSLSDSTPTTPLYFILSPGANVVADLDALAVKYGFVRGESYHNVSMGQGQDVVAMEKLEAAHRNGHWVILNNIHLMPRWLVELEKKMDEFALEGSHAKYRLFLTSDPSKQIPIGVLNRCIKLTNEPPAGLKANLKRAFCFFSKEYIDEAESKFKSILFGLCHFHAIMMERKLYGALGFNMLYPFSVGDLRDSSVCLANYLENSGGGKIPWPDLKYIFGEIMYGGHIVNDFDRLLANSYLDFFMKDELLDETEMFPFAEGEGVSFMCPAPSSYDRYLEHMDTELKVDTPIAFGLHPNAEIGFRTTQSENLFRTIMELQPRDGGGGEGGLSPQHVAENALNDIMDRFGEKRFDVEEIVRSLEETGPYQNVFIQECNAMNVLLAEIVRSLQELNLGFAGELTMSDSMEQLMDALFLDRVPKSWGMRAWASLRPLSSWLHNVSLRITQLEEWTASPSDIPKVTWLSGLINPQSFLTAIMQVTAQRNTWELDKLVIQTDVTKRSMEEVETPSRDGAYVHGLSMQGARWDLQATNVEKSHPKEMFCSMPVINCKAVAADKAEINGIFQCPVYKTENRGPTYVFSAQLKTKSPPARWVLAGVALIMDVVSS